MQLVPWYLSESIVGYDDEGEEGSPEDAPDDADDGEDEGEPGESEATDGGEKPPSAEDVEKLNRALRAERKLRREAQKEANALKKSKSEPPTPSEEEVEQLRQQNAAETAKSERLAAGLRNTAIENAIVKAASPLKFRDIDDVLTLVDRNEIDWEQDEDDPSKVTVDGDSVKDAVKVLAKKRPYLIESTADSDVSGGKFGGGKKTDNALSEETLRETYPALRRGAL